jgi:SagB-type dehydrogenase family enzyme
MTRGVGDNFQQSTKYERGRMAGGYLDWANEPAAFKEYPGAPRVALVPPASTGGQPIWDVLMRRRSIRDFDHKPIAATDISQLLWAAQGITAVRLGHQFRAAPSAGALYPVETYIVVHSVENMASGVYHYDPREHALDQIKAGDYRLAVSQSALDQDMAFAAGAVFIWTAVFQRAKWKYNQRAYRYVYLDAGHIAQNVALAAVALGLGTCQLAAFYDSEVNELVGANGSTESAIYMTVVGKPAE